MSKMKVPVMSKVLAVPLERLRFLVHGMWPRPGSIYVYEYQAAKAPPKAAVAETHKCPCKLHLFPCMLWSPSHSGEMLNQ